MSLPAALLRRESFPLLPRGAIDEAARCDQQQPRAGGSRWAKATLLQALGWVVFGVWRGVVPDLASVVIGNGLLLLSLGVYLSVLAEFSGRTTRPSSVYALVALQSFGLAYFLVASPNVAARIVVTSVWDQAGHHHQANDVAGGATRAFG